MKVQLHPEMRTDIGNMKFCADDREPQFVVERARIHTRIAPKQLGGLFARKGGAAEDKSPAEPGPLRVGSRRHPAQLQRGQARRFRQFRLEKRRNAEQLPVAKCPKVFCGQKIVARKKRRFDWPSGSKHGVS